MEYPRITQLEIETIKKAQAGDKIAFSKLFKKYKGFVDHVLFTYIKDMDEAKDLTNLVFLKVHQKLSQFVEYDTFGGWLRIIANHTAIDYLRRRKERALGIGEEGDSKSEHVTTSKEFDDEEDSLASYLNRDIIKQAMSSFPYSTQRIFYLFYVKDLTCEEIGNIMKMPEGTIKARLSRTRKRLAKIIKL